MKFKVEVRKNCKICKKKIESKRFRTYCSASCRNKFHNSKHREGQSEWQRRRNDARASIPSDKKVQCLICKGWYVQICSHAVQRHGLTGRQYREAFDLEVKRGVVPAWYREMKGGTVFRNGTVENLKKGKKYWFKVGDKKAGRYHRSPATLARLKVLYKLRKNENIN